MTRFPELFRGALSALLAVATAAPLPAQRTATPAPTGPHAVGRRALTWTDTARRDPADTTRPRVIPGWVWYPADAVRGGSQPPLDSAWNALRATASAQKIGPAAAEAMRDIRVHAVTDAPFAPSVQRAPVLLFVPGNGWLPTDYSTLLEDLASHGYVVVGIAPTGLSDVVRFADGRVVGKVLGVGAAIGTDQREAHEDMLLAIRRLADMTGPFSGRLDLTRIGVFGHSLGGTTALVAASRDTLVRAVINLDGDPMGDVRDARPRQPVLFVSHELPSMSEAPPPPDTAWTRLTREGMVRSEARRSGEWQAIASQAAWSRRLRILGMRHLNFTDAALASSLIEGPRLRWMRWGPIDGARGLRIVADVTRAFFDQVLLGIDGGEILCEAGCAYAEVVVVP
ncbi:MAG TPA: hypothetical protein VFT96_01715 [Gemmatimonadaceae bacterium]|nr:hypothetical protein [Gemmatimonadaceae bacterium]